MQRNFIFQERQGLIYTDSLLEFSIAYLKSSKNHPARTACQACLMLSRGHYSGSDLWQRLLGIPALPADPDTGTWCTQLCALQGPTRASTREPCSSQSSEHCQPAKMPHDFVSAQQVILLFFFKVYYLFVWKAERQRQEKQRHRPSHPLMHSPNGHNSQDYSRLGPRARNSESPTWVTCT